ncbi:hypothetical protein VTO73DRAFT_13824 [Trametes versicolor]
MCTGLTGRASRIPHPECYIARCRILLRQSRPVSIAHKFSGSHHSFEVDKTGSRTRDDFYPEGIVAVAALGESQADPLPARLNMRKSPPLYADSSSSKLVPVTLGMSHAVQHATAPHPHTPRVNETGGDRSARYRAAHHRQRA